ncbi:MAG TPA: hypothetical protein P5077_04930 [bacterium]|nr:hypothetical protein [bacterium]
MRARFDHALFIALLLGLVTVLSQTVLIRELMIATGAFELVVAVGLSLWMLFTGAGAVASVLFPILRRPFAPPVLLALVAIIAVGQLFLVHPVAALFGTVGGMALSVPAMVAVTAIVLAPGCLVGGLAFPACVATVRGGAERTGLVYLIESVGMALGAALFYLFMEFFSPVRHPIFLAHYGERYRPEELVLSRDGRSGRLDVTRRGDQTAYFWNGQAAGVAGPSRPAEAFAGFALTQRPDPRRIAVIGGLLAGTAVEVARKSPEAVVTVIESEPMFEEVFAAGTVGRNGVLRFGDPGAVLRELPPQDLIIIDLPAPSSVSLSRFFSREFFSFLQKDNGPAMVLVVGLSGGQGMLTPETAALNRSVQLALRAVFRKVLLLPASRHLWVAADNDLPTADPVFIEERMERRGLAGDWFNTALVQDVIEPMHRELTGAAIEKADARENRLLRPAALFETLRHTARRLDRPLPSLFSSLPSRPLSYLGVTFLFAVIVAVALSRLTRRRMAPARSAAIFAVSGGAFTLQLALMALLQLHVGQIYHLIAIFTVSFTVGLTAGLWVSRRMVLPLNLSAGALAFLSLATAWSADSATGAAFPVAMNFLAGLSAGLSFGTLLRGSGDGGGAAFYLADLVGAALCGLLFGAFMVPLYDLRWVFGAVAILALAGMAAGSVRERASGR